MLIKLINIFLKNKLWLITYLIICMIFELMLWLLDSKSFIYIFPVSLLGTIIIFCICVYILYRKEEKQIELITEFIDNPIIENQEKVIELFSEYNNAIFSQVGSSLRKKNSTIILQDNKIEEYEEYVETWAHEIKNPLGLLTFVLDNRKEELSPILYNRLEYSRTLIQENIERMLYYARLKSICNDYFFENLCLENVFNEIIEDYKILFQEKRISIIKDFSKESIYSDKKGLQFMIVQIISNSIKYVKTDTSFSFIHFSSYYNSHDDKIKLAIKDNGIGIKSYDLPFIFDKGFTGEVGKQRKNSTGMGLYFLKKISEQLKIEIDTCSDGIEGFKITLSFPNVHVKNN
ncbi:MAG: sensor histidine kinase [Clostridiales bacterium]